jgi:ABC-type lipoprotein release transport system permease subunit
VRAIPGVSAVAPRWEISAVDAFSLGEITYAIAFRGDHTPFEDPKLVSGQRLHGPGEAEVGQGLAQVLGLGVGSTLALTTASGRELRLRVSGVVAAVEHDGRVAYVPERALLRAEPAAPEQLAVVVSSGADTAAVAAKLEALGPKVTTAAGGVVGTGTTLVDALRALLLTIAIVDGLVCLYMLVQALTLTASERGSAIAVLRACGAGPGSIRALLAGTALAVIVPAAAIAVALERFVLGPAVAGIAAGYATLPLAADLAEVVVLLAGLALIGVLAVWWVARRLTSRPIARSLA